MALIFYVHGEDKDLDAFYANYTGGTDWNKHDPRYPEGTTNFENSLSIARTKEGMKSVLLGFASKFVLKGQKLKKQSGGKAAGDAISLLDMMEKDDMKVYVLKGIHQQSNPHVTLAFAGQLFHAYVEGGLQGQANLFKITKISVGDAVKDDPDGWKVA